MEASGNVSLLTSVQLASTLVGYLSFSAQNTGSSTWQAMSATPPKSHQPRQLNGR
jgi:hypothetical protein